MMPNYHYFCATCGDSEVWQSIHADTLTTGGCGHMVVKVIDKVTPMRLGPSDVVRRADATERQWDKDMPAYKRFREKGYQPPGIDGCDRLEATAKSNIEIQSGGRLKYSDERVNEGRQQAEDITKGRI